MSTPVAPENGVGGNPMPPVVPNNVRPVQSRNTVGLIGLIVAVVGFILACIPGIVGLGWFLLFVGFVLGIVALFQRDKSKKTGIWAIIVSIVGSIVAAIVFMAVVANAVNDALGGSDSKVSSPSSNAAAGGSSAVSDQGSQAGEAGSTRENPAPLGSSVEGKDWTIKVNSVSLNANDEVKKANSFNDAPEKGTVYIMVNYTATYTGDDAEGQMPMMTSVDYVTADGVTIDGTEKMVVGPKPIDLSTNLYKGASVTDNDVFQVPTPADGVLVVRPGMIADKVFVAVK